MKVFVLLPLLMLLAWPARSQQLPPVTADEAALHAQLGQTEFMLGRRMQEILQLQQQIADLKAKGSKVDPPPEGKGETGPPK